MKRQLLDITGKPLEAKAAIISAFVALARGKADAWQQKAVLQMICELGGINTARVAAQSEQGRTYMDGAEWLAHTVLALSGTILTLHAVGEAEPMGED